MGASVFGTRTASRCIPLCYLYPSFTSLSLICIAPNLDIGEVEDEVLIECFCEATRDQGGTKAGRHNYFSGNHFSQPLGRQRRLRANRRSPGPEDSLPEASYTDAIRFTTIN